MQYYRETARTNTINIFNPKTIDLRYFEGGLKNIKKGKFKIVCFYYTK